MKAIVPKTFRTGAIVDSEDVNANLQAIARDITRLADARYTYSTMTIDITGIVDTDTAAERTIPFCRPTSGATLYPIDIVGVEVSIYATSGVTWTLTVTDENSTTVAITVDTAGTTTEGYASSNIPLQVDSATRLDFVLSASAGSTITRGTVTVHVRADRHAQNATTPPSYSPTLIDASTSTAATAINAELVLAATARTLNSTTNVLDVRGCCLVANDLAAAQIWRLPSGAGAAGLRMVCAAVGVAARSVTANSGTGNVVVSTTALTDIVVGTSTLDNKSDDPTDTTDDLVVTLTPTGGAISRVFVFLWWS